MNPYLTGEQLRQWASKCLQEATAVTSEEECKWLQSMYHGLLEVAATRRASVQALFSSSS